MSRLIAPAVAGVALVLLFSLSASAQIDTGAIVGRVADDSGAVLPGVNVTAVQEGTDVSASTVTNTRGEFTFPGLRVGRYTVAAELQGFRRAIQRDVVVNVQTRAQVDFTLEVGSVSEEVVVTGTTELLQTQTADIGNVVDERQVRDLPLLGRRYSELAFLAPGVVAAPAGITSRGEDTFFNANGNYATWNNYTLDGADNNSLSTNLQERSPQVVAPPVDALQEFKVQTRTYSAEFGKAAGAVINASVKQGTNQFRGTRLRVLPRRGAERQHLGQQPRRRGERAVQPAHRRRRCSAVRWCARRTFFFGDYQARAPSARCRRRRRCRRRGCAAGDLSELTGSDGRQQPVRARRLRGRRQQDHQSESCIDPVARQAHRRCFRMPNVPGTGFFNNNFISNGILNNDVDQFDVRVDHSLSAGRDHMFGRYSFQNTDRRRAADPRTTRWRPATSPATSSIAARTPSGGWSRVFGSDDVQRVPRRRTTRCARTSYPSRVRHRLERAVRHQGRAERSAFLRRPAAHADRALRAPRRTVLPAAVPEVAGLPVRREPHVAARPATR